MSAVATFRNILPVRLAAALASLPMTSSQPDKEGDRYRSLLWAWFQRRSQPTSVEAGVCNVVAPGALAVLVENKQTARDRRPTVSRSTS